MFLKKEFEKFLWGSYGLEVWSGKKIVFRSKKEGIQGFLDFLKKYGRHFQNLIVFDKKVGNAIALLCAFLKVKKIYAVVGSESAEKTLRKYGIKFHIFETIPKILNKKGNDLCPFEKLSLGKTPTQFYNSLIDQGQTLFNPK